MDYLTHVRLEEQDQVLAYLIERVTEIEKKVGIVRETKENES